VPVVEIQVKTGDEVKPDDPLITLESDKAAMDVPAPLKGKVAEILVHIGDKVSEGAAILRLDVSGEDAKADTAPTNGKAQEPHPEAQSKPEKSPQRPENVLPAD